MSAAAPKIVVAMPHAQTIGTPEPVRPFPSFTVDGIKAEAVPQIIQRLVAGVTVVCGVPNSGKSAFMVDAGLHVAGNRPFFGRKVHACPVLYVAAEAPASIVARARAGIAAKFDGRRLPFHIVRDMPRFGSEADAALDLERLVETTKDVASMEGEAIGLSIWDTAAMMLGGGEENGAGMVLLTRCAVEFRERTGIAVAIIHHPSKADPTSPRGHTSLPAAADAIVMIDLDPLTKVRTARVVKGRDFETGGEIHFALEVVNQPEPDSFGDPATTVLVRATETTPTRKVAAQGKNQQHVMAALREWSRTHADQPAISTDDLTGLLKGCGFNHKRKLEMITYLTTTGILTASIGGYIVNRGFL